jgi:putative effector of murein hydrolase LrgA (UPF0299 family)
MNKPKEYVRPFVIASFTLGIWISLFMSIGIPGEIWGAYLMMLGFYFKEQEHEIHKEKKGEVTNAR